MKYILIAILCLASTLHLSTRAASAPRSPRAARRGTKRKTPPIIPQTVLYQGCAQLSFPLVRKALPFLEDAYNQEIARREQKTLLIMAAVTQAAGISRTLVTAIIIPYLRDRFTLLNKIPLSNLTGNKLALTSDEGGTFVSAGPLLPCTTSLLIQTISLNMTLLRIPSFIPDDGPREDFHIPMQVTLPSRNTDPAHSDSNRWPQVLRTIFECNGLPQALLDTIHSPHGTFMALSSLTTAHIIYTADRDRIAYTYYKPHNGILPSDVPNLLVRTQSYFHICSTIAFSPTEETAALMTMTEGGQKYIENYRIEEDIAITD